MNVIQKVIISFSLSIMLCLPAGAVATETVTQVAEENIFARIDDAIITENEFDQIFRAAVRNKYYHGRVPEEELRIFRKQVAQDIVDQVLVHREAVKLGLQPDTDKIKLGIAGYDEKYAGSPDWQDQREKVLPGLLNILERKNLIEKMEARIKKVAKPDTDHVLRYYQQTPDKFTEPRRDWVSVILLAVPPSGSSQMWEQAFDAAAQFKQQIDQGEDFAALAQKFSGHSSAVNGGDMGYLHQGILEEDAQKLVANLQPGEVSEPLRVLEGVTIFRLNGIQSAKLKPFDEVRQRAAGLLQRALQDKAWDDYVRKLKDSADIYVNEKIYVLK